MALIRKFETLGLIVLVSLIALDGYLWFIIFFGRPANDARDNFLNTGKTQGALIILPGGAKFMIDDGPTDSLTSDDHYIDLAIISRPEAPEFNGYNSLLDHYTIGAFVYNGRDADPGIKGWVALLQKIKDKNIPLITLGAQDKIYYGKSEIDFLSPDQALAKSPDLADTSFVMLIKTPAMKTLVANIMGSEVGRYLLEKGSDMKAEILSEKPDTEAFLRAVDPRIIVPERTSTITIYAEGGRLKFLLYNKGK
jgi:beta-lactamase superfamily II metal-dependent hydrolase